MKTKLRFKALGILIALLLSILIGSCTKEEPLMAPESDSPTNLTLKNGSIDDMVCDLIAGQNILAGQVIYSHDATNLYVTYLASNGWTLTEVHLYVGSLANLPTNKKAVQIGQFPYSTNDLVGNTITIPLLDLEGNMNGDGSVTIAAHAIVVNGQQEETAWANCTYIPVISVKSLFTNNKWAASDGDRFTNTNINDYCYWLTTNSYVKNAEYPLYSYYYQTVVSSPGTVIVSDNGVYLSITVNAIIPLKHTFIYVGTMENLIANYSSGGTCLDYENFPYQVDTPAGATTHTYSVSMPNVSFQNAFGSDRWGWINHYNF